MQGPSVDESVVVGRSFSVVVGTGFTVVVGWGLPSPSMLISAHALKCSWGPHPTQLTPSSVPQLFAVL